MELTTGYTTSDVVPEIAGLKKDGLKKPNPVGITGVFFVFFFIEPGF